VSEKFPYQRQWEEYRERQVIFWLVFIAYLPAMILLTEISKRVFQNESVVFAGFCVFALGWGFCGYRLSFWKCPRCAKSFHLTWWWQNIFATKCLHCKLPKYEGSTLKNY
jgi:hypothetical protein